MEGPRGMDLEVQRKSKKQFIIQELVPCWLSWLPQWKVARGSDYFLVILSEALSATLTGRLALFLCKCSAWKCLTLSPSPSLLWEVIRIKWVIRLGPSWLNTGRFKRKGGETTAETDILSLSHHVPSRNSAENPNKKHFHQMWLLDIGPKP